MFNSRSVGGGAIASALIVLGFIVSTGAANAATGPSAIDEIKTAIAACGKLPLSERETCKSEAQARYDPALTPAPHPGTNESIVAALHARYKEAMAACARLPISERNTCTAQAAAAYFGPRAKLDYPMSASAQHAITDETRRYEAALATCAKLPLCERTTCESDAGLASSLAKPAAAGRS
jgi:hypothetical protein